FQCPHVENSRIHDCGTTGFTLRGRSTRSKFALLRHYLEFRECFSRILSTRLRSLGVLNRLAHCSICLARRSGDAQAGFMDPRRSSGMRRNTWDRAKIRERDDNRCIALRDHMSRLVECKGTVMTAYVFGLCRMSEQGLSAPYVAVSMEAEN